MVTAGLHDVIERAIRMKLAPLTITSVAVEEGKNAFNDDALFVTVHLPREAEIVPGDKLLSAMAAVSDAVIDLGDDRFPHVRTLRAEEVPADDETETQH